MENYELFEKIVEQAENKGYEKDLLDIFVWNSRYEIMFNHDFAKAYFGEKDYWTETNCTCGGFYGLGMDIHLSNCAKLNAKRGYKFYLKELVLLKTENKRLKYLSKFLEN